MKRYLFFILVLGFVCLGWKNPEDITKRIEELKKEQLQDVEYIQKLQNEENAVSQRCLKRQGAIEELQKGIEKAELK